MKRIQSFLILLLSLFLANFLIFPSFTKAEGEFTTDLDVTYAVKDTGITEVTNKITLTNVFSNLYATSYTIILDSINPKNIKSYDLNGPLISEVTVNDNKTTISIKFNDAVVGKDKSRTFWISFEESSFAVRTGEVWEISVPRLSENASFSTYYVNLLIPEKLGQEAYVSPEPIEKFNSNGYIHYKFNKESVTKTGIVAGFGEFQVFSFTLNYHLENPLKSDSLTEITLPPDTAYQRVYYSDINPKPIKITEDLDGNWIATYSLKARERVDVVATGNVQIFSSLRSFLKPSEESLNESLKSDLYWETTDPEIVKLAGELKTPREIYKFVSEKLQYDFSRVQPNVERFGASKTLTFPNNAICMEFTDLFIAIARVAGIPAREINGFAYTENPDIQPLSLVNDVLHAWPEYYDNEKEAWIPIDPTWGSTTGGVDYFNKLDLRHFTFVIHGKNSKTPYAAGSYKLGANPQKDVYVSFGELPKLRSANLTLTSKLSGWIPLVSNKLDFEIINNGPTAVYNLNPKIFFDNKEIDTVVAVKSLLPFSSFKSSVDIPFSFLATRTPDIVRVLVQDHEITVKTTKKEILIYNLLFVFVFAISIIITILFRLKKWRIPNFQTIKAFFSKKAN